MLSKYILFTIFKIDHLHVALLLSTPNIKDKVFVRQYENIPLVLDNKLWTSSVQFIVMATPHTTASSNLNNFTICNITINSLEKYLYLSCQWKSKQEIKLIIFCRLYKSLYLFIYIYVDIRFA